MKHSYYVILLGLISFSSCRYPFFDRGGHNIITVINESDKSIDVNYQFDYPDTDYGLYDIHHELSTSRVKPNSTNTKALQLPEKDSWESRFNSDWIDYKIQNDTLIIQIFDSNIVDIYTWYYIRHSKLAEQVYYVSLLDLEMLNWTIVYPPSKEMKDIKMWPPFN